MTDDREPTDREIALEALKRMVADGRVRTYYDPASGQLVYRKVEPDESKAPPMDSDSNN